MKQETFVTLYTEEGEHLTGQPWDVYPRPQMKRDSFFNLNGDWDFRENGGEKQTIRVPFPPESVLSGIGRRLGKDPSVCYEKHFRRPEGFENQRTLLHFGAVDQIATVTLNGTVLGTHEGGYEAFSFDVTEHLREENRLTVEVLDRLSDYVLPYGKQCEQRGGMWYTPVTGIWQTVWMENVPQRYIRGLNTETFENGVKITVDGVSEGRISVETPKGTLTKDFTEGSVVIPIADPRKWSPEDPYLYRFTVETAEDRVESYFALRTLEIKTVDGIPRLCLNGKPYFFHGLLDQGYFSDGIFLPATPKGYENDILAMKELGFNTLRKHIKIEPEQFYYDCDRLGMIVFQDMVNNGPYSFFRDTALPTVGMKRFGDRWLHRNPKRRAAFKTAMEQTVRQLKNHPCICYWTIFNEGWGQFNSAEMYDRLKQLDDSRFIDATSGWFRGSKSDVESLHVYFKPIRLKKADKPVVLSEFGGYSYQPKDHVFHPGKPYGYRFFTEQESFEQALVDLYETQVLPSLGKGLCAAIYTQVSDVEDETNGLLSYDRKVLNVSPERMKALAEKLKL